MFDVIRPYIVLKVVDRIWRAVNSMPKRRKCTDVAYNAITIVTQSYHTMSRQTCWGLGFLKS